MGARTYNLSSVGGIKFAHLNLQVSYASYTSLVVTSTTTRGPNYHIRSLWINAYTYNLSFPFPEFL